LHGRHIGIVDDGELKNTNSIITLSITEISLLMDSSIVAKMPPIGVLSNILASASHNNGEGTQM
jgi:hypothetical protein